MITTQNNFLFDKLKARLEELELCVSNQILFMKSNSEALMQNGFDLNYNLGIMCSAYCLEAL